MTKPELARRILQRLLETGMGIGWFTADAAYGDNPGLRTWLADVGLSLRPSLTTPNWCVCVWLCSRLPVVALRD